MNRSVYASLADKKIMIDYGDMIFSQLNVYPGLGQDVQILAGWHTELNLCQHQGITSYCIREFTSTYEAPKFAAAINDWIM